MSTARRYQFDNPLPAVPDTTPPVVYQPQPLPAAYADQPQQLVVQHIHQAAPDRTVQRLALGAGTGAGVVGAGVYFGPLLVASLTSIAVSLAVVAIVAVAAGWTVVSVVRAVDGHADAKSVRKAAGGGRR